MRLLMGRFEIRGSRDYRAPYALGPARLLRHLLVDNNSCMIVGVQATAAHKSGDGGADMLTRFSEWQGRAIRHPM